MTSPPISDRRTWVASFHNAVSREFPVVVLYTVDIFLERKMSGYVNSFLFRVVLVLLAALPALSQTPQWQAPSTPAAPKARPPENLPWTRFHPAAPPYRPTDAEKQQIQAKIDQLDRMIRELRSTRVDDGLLADVEIYAEAARWKMAYPEEFFRQVSVADTLSVLDKGIKRAVQLREGNRRGQAKKAMSSAAPARLWMVRCNRCASPFPTSMTAYERFRLMSPNMVALHASMKSKP
jgi:hypothetical protein